SKIVVHDERGVVGEASPLVYGGRARPPRERAAHHLLVDAPADVLGVGLPTVGPPGVQIRFAAHLAEGIHVAGRAEERVHPGALLGQEPGVLLVRSPVAQIDRAMRDVPVATQYVVTPAA